MKGDFKMIEYFNGVLKFELVVVNQYFLYVCMFKDWGFVKIVEVEYEELIDEMKYVDQLIECIFFLEGLFNV